MKPTSKDTVPSHCSQSKPETNQADAAVSYCCTIEILLDAICKHPRPSEANGHMKVQKLKKLSVCSLATQERNIKTFRSAPQLQCKLARTQNIVKSPRVHFSPLSRSRQGFDYEKGDRTAASSTKFTVG